MRETQTSSASWHEVLVWGMTAFAWAVAVWGVWVPGHSVGTQVLGVDMAEAVKFLPAVRSGQVHIWREGFLLPQVTLSLFLSVHAWQPRWPFSTGVRVILTVAAAAVALSMLPPAWTPAVLRAGEWRLQVMFILLGLLAAAVSPLGRYLPAQVGDVLLLALGLGTTFVLFRQLARVWPDFESVYNVSLTYGPGVWAVVVGVLGLVVLVFMSLHARRA